MPTLFDPSARGAMHARVDGLAAGRVPHWGEMDARRMVCHVADQLRVALGDLESRPGPLRLRFGNREVKGKPGPLRFRWYRQLMVHWAPWPKARVKAPPEMLPTKPAVWDDDVAALHALIDRVGDKDPAERWAVHPWFGPVSGREWGMLCWKHLDHHLRQFGA